MTYQVLARKWRPQQFSEMIGQEHVLRALINALDTQRLHHAYLFTGMRGVGKTTIARVFAKSLNCETNGISSSPCGECSSCRDIEAGSYIDLIEVDAASKTGVDDTRELLENVPYAPASGRFKVYLIDEVHMFSKSAFNALLKTLEEPPEHVKFLLATTDPEKVLVTILSRCLQFNLKSVPPSVLCDYLGQLLDQESISWEPTALSHIAEAAEGSVRDSLSLVEQAAAFGQGRVTAADVESMLGRLSPSRVIDLLTCIEAGDASGVLSQINQLAEYGPDYAQLLGSLLSAIHQIALIQAAPDSLGDAVVNRERLEKLATQMSPEDAQLYYQIGLLGRRDMPHAPDQRAALEMVLLRMLSFRPVTSSLASGGNGAAQGANTSGSNAQTQPVAQNKLQSHLSVKSPVNPDSSESSMAVISDSVGLAPAQPAAGSSAVAYSGSDPVGADNPSISAPAPNGNMDPDTSVATRSGNAAANAARKAMLEAALAVTPDDARQPRTETQNTTKQPSVTEQIVTARHAAPADPTPPSESSPGETMFTEPLSAAPTELPGDAGHSGPGDENSRTGELAGKTVLPTEPLVIDKAEAGRCEVDCPQDGDQQVNPAQIEAETNQYPANESVSITAEVPVASVNAGTPWHAGNWLQVTEQLGLDGMPGQLLNQCAFVSLQDNLMNLQMENEFAHLMSEPFVKKVQDSISKLRQIDTSVSIALTEHPIDSPARIQARQKELAMEAARLSIQQDPLVKALIEKVDGVVDESSVRPV